MKARGSNSLFNQWSRLSSTFSPLTLPLLYHILLPNPIPNPQIPVPRAGTEVLRPLAHCLLLRLPGACRWRDADGPAATRPLVWRGPPQSGHHHRLAHCWHEATQVWGVKVCTHMMLRSHNNFCVNFTNSVDWDLFWLTNLHCSICFEFMT